MDLSVLGGAPPQNTVEEAHEDVASDADVAQVVHQAIFVDNPDPTVARKQGKRRKLEAYISAQTDEGRELVDHALAAMRSELLTPRDRARAREFLADRLFGRSISVTGAVKHGGTITHAHEGSTEIIVKPYDLARLSDAELEQMETLARKALPASSPDDTR